MYTPRRPWLLWTHRLVWISIISLTRLCSGQNLDYGPCYRDCTGAFPMVCHYTFTEEIYNALNVACGRCAQGVVADCSRRQCVPLDGVERTVFSINRMLPGPAIHVCAGDTVVVDLHVRLAGRGDSIHWHGLQQVKTPYMDGVSMVTQCPVMAGQQFRYRFLADEPGTYFYHPHNGINKVNGGVGVLVARGPRDADPTADLYDADLAEHAVVLMDWMHVDAEYVYPGLQHPKGQQADSILINGRGHFLKPDGNWTLTPPAEFRMQRGLRYRLRIINSGGLSCPVVLRVPGHTLTVIASDSRDVQPLAVDTLYTFSGERYDVVVAADQDGDVFWVHAYTGGVCAGGRVDQVALLRYTDADGHAPTGLPASPRPSVHQLQPEGVVMNSPGCGQLPEQLCVTDLQNVKEPEDPKMLGSAEPENATVLGVKFHEFTYEELYGSEDYPNFITFGTNLAGVIGNVSYMTPASPLLSQPGASPVCGGCPDDRRDFCSCTHLIKVPLGVRFEMVLVDQTDVSPAGPEGMLSHPMHLHGYLPYVLALGSLVNITSGMERLRYVRSNAGLLRASAEAGANGPRPLARPPNKDVVMLPHAGYAILRFKADNPGMWFFHCHFQYHMVAGMEATIQVGEYDDFAKIPPNFPTCGNYIPDN